MRQFSITDLARTNHMFLGNSADLENRAAARLRVRRTFLLSRGKEALLLFFPIDWGILQKFLQCQVGSVSPR